MSLIRPRHPGWLERYFRRNPGRLMDKWLHYFDIYERHFAFLRGRPITVVEIGVYHGGSLQMWRRYFGRRATIYGVDIDDRTLTMKNLGAEVIIGDQADRSFLTDLVRRVGPIDLVIDDGGHTMEQQIATFEVLWPAVRSGGVYLAEDLHTSYWPEFGGGFRRPSSFIEFAKTLIDQQHAWHARAGDGLVVDDVTRTLRGMHIYDSVIVFDKGEVIRPTSEISGEPSFPLLDDR